MRLLLSPLLLVASLAGEPTAVQAQSAEEAGVETAVTAFHAALTSGDAAGVTRLLADDALMMEAGGMETREEYVKNHLPLDIAFEKAVPGQRKRVRTVVRGDGAWVTTTADFVGTFENRRVDLQVLELTVLSREQAGWRIRAIHWSSRNRRVAR